jgi:tetratricopeptide (TPR) repeat protein
MTSEFKAIAKTDDWSKVYNLAETYQKEEQWQQAAQAFEQAIELKEDFFWSYHHLGDILSRLQQWDMATQAYGKAVKLDPNFFWSWHNLGDALTKLQQWDMATQAYGKAVKLNPDFFWSWHNLGDALTKLQQWDMAIANYIQGNYLQAEHQPTYQKLGTVFKQRGTLAQSIKDYRQLIQFPLHNSVFEFLRTQPKRLIDLAESLVKQHQIQAAIVVYYMVLEIQPQQTNIRIHLAQLLQQQSQLEQAIAHNQQKLEENTTSSLLAHAETIPLAKSLPKSIPGRILIQSNTLISFQQLNDLHLAVGWSSRPLTQLEQSLKASFSWVSAIYIHQDKQQLIGFARAISDSVFHATLLDIAVHPDFQGRKVGKNIVKTLVEQLHQAQIKDIILFASPHLVDFYHKLGFLSQPNNLQWMLWCPTSDEL